jgi:hypothetical protein
MSAWIVAKPHIDRIVTAALLGASDDIHFLPIITVAEADAVGQMLVTENVKSVEYRYPSHAKSDDLPGPYEAYYRKPYKFERKDLNTRAEIANAIACLDYQSCEHDGWASSEASKFLERLSAALRLPDDLDSMPGIDKAPWGFDK